MANKAMKNCFRSKHSKKSYTTNNQKRTICILENGIKLPKVGKVKALIHRQPEADWELKSAIITQEADGTYYVSVLYFYEKEMVCVGKESRKVLGLDYKSDGLYMDSNGTDV